MVKMSDAQRRKIFKLAGEKGLDDEMLHGFVHKITGKKSLKTLSIREAVDVIDGLEGKMQNADNMISDKQRKYIEGLAKEIGWVDDKNRLDSKRLNAFVESKFAVTNVKWLTTQKASQVIEALKAMKSRTQKAM